MAYSSGFMVATPMGIPMSRKASRVSCREQNGLQIPLPAIELLEQLSRTDRFLAADAIELRHVIDQGSSLHSV